MLNNIVNLTHLVFRKEVQQITEVQPPVQRGMSKVLNLLQLVYVWRKDATERPDALPHIVFIGHNVWRRTTEISDLSAVDVRLPDVTMVILLLDIFSWDLRVS